MVIQAVVDEGEGRTPGTASLINSNHIVLLYTDRQIKDSPCDLLSFCVEFITVMLSLSLSYVCHRHIGTCTCASGGL